jgi:single-strand DNA-binding protein
MYINKVILVGNITKDLELKSLPTGNKVLEVGLATNRSYKDANGQKVESVDYHNIVCYGKTAELVAQYMKKGYSIYVEGRLTTRSWDDKTTGQKRYRTEIIAENVQFGNNKRDSGSAPSAGAESSKPDTKSSSSNDSMGAIDYGDTINPDDIPF